MFYLLRRKEIDIIPDRIVPGPINKAVLFVERLLPRFVVTHLMGKFLKPKD